MTPQRKQHLHTQYVLSIVNDGDWYREFGRMLEGNTAWLRRMPSEVLKYVKPIARQRGEELSVECRAFIYLQIGAYYGHSPEDVRDAMDREGTFRSVMTKLIENSAALTTTSTPIEQEPEPMNQTANTAVAFETKHYVYGMDVANMTSGQLIDAIKKLEVEIADLKAVKTKSTHIAKRIAELGDMLGKVVEVLDAK